jgi:tRNA threonylcarbamoyladenosine biosynthesis protein TsaE
MTEFLPDDAATGALAQRLAAALPESTGGLTLLLRGELGAGKSTFARALLRALGHEGPVPSPTYTLVEPYELSAGPVYHIDLYRIASEEELRYLGWTELDEGFRMVEWPDRAPGIVSDADLLLTLEYRDPGRQAGFQGLSTVGREILARMQPATEPVD